MLESDLKRVETSFKMESFNLLTEDSYSLSSMGAIMALAGNGYEEVLSSDYPYSRLSVSAGFTLAVLITCELTVSTVVRMTIASGRRKNHQPIPTR